MIPMRHIAAGIVLWLGVAPEALPQASPQRAAAIESLANAERAFARRSVETGIQPSFLEYFAPDGINFTPHPVNTRQALSQRPLPVSKPPITLNWSPIFADVSAAGDLGYTTGPYLLTDDNDGSVRSQGFYFSVWKKQPDGAWRVLIDFGMDTPTFADKPLSRPFVPTRVRNGPARGESLKTAPQSVAKVNFVFDMFVTRGSLAKTYQSYSAWDDETRLLRSGEFPLVGAKAIGAYLASQQPFSKLEAIASGVAASGDLGYAYGRWERSKGDNASKGYYVRVWKLTGKGWRLVAEVMNPLPPESK